MKTVTKLTPDEVQSTELLPVIDDLIEAEVAEAERETAAFEAECEAKREARLATMTKYRRHYWRNKAKKDAENALRRAGPAAPLWLTEELKEAIVAIYEKSDKLSEATGVRHEVDHIVPLHGTNNGKRVVRGLHVPWNLRAIPGSLNRIRGNFHYMGIDSSAGAASSGDDYDDIPY